MRVLILDDDIISSSVVQSALRQGGHEILTATDGQQAMRMIRDGACQLVLSDLSLPNVDGLALCRAIRSEDLQSYVYVILLTDHSLLKDRLEGLRAGADDILSKPFEPEELLARVHTAERILSLETRDVTIFALARLAESRDPETGAHLERVRSYSRILTESLMGLSHYPTDIDAEFVRLIYLTSPLHDIGKVGIPDAILLKPGPLTETEFEVMKTHTILGAQTLNAAVIKFPGVKFLRMARDIAASHHERFDGNGYPLGLKGEGIPLSARIVAVADVYDALTSKRVYKSAMSYDRAFAMIIRERGSQFDPQVVDAFARNEARFAAVPAQFFHSEPLAA